MNPKITAGGELAAPESTRLYHGMPMHPVGTAIVPSTNYGTELSARVRRLLGIPPGARPGLVYATPDLQHATAFALNGLKNAMLFGRVDSGVYYGIFCDREPFLAAALAGAVFAFESTEFVKMSDNHFVSMAGVPFERTRRAVTIGSVTDAMRVGLQVFTVREAHVAGQPWPYDGFQSKELAELAPYIARGQVFWENYVADINPDPSLLAVFRDVLPSRPATVETPS